MRGLSDRKLYVAECAGVLLGTPNPFGDRSPERKHKHSIFPLPLNPTPYTLE